MKKETNPEIWERIKREAAEQGRDPYKMLLEHIERGILVKKPPAPNVKRV